MVVAVIMAPVLSVMVAMIVVADHGPTHPANDGADRTGHHRAANRAGHRALGRIGDRPGAARRPQYRQRASADKKPFHRYLPDQSATTR
jgi:hypothetical protein